VPSGGTEPSDEVATTRGGRAVRWTAFVVGAASLGLGVALSVASGRGLGPWQALETGLVARTGLSFGTVVLLESVLAVAIAWAFLRTRPGPATLVIAVTLGPAIDRVLPLLPTPQDLLLANLQLLVGTLLFGAGIAVYLAADLGPSAQDALFVGVTRRFGWSVGRARLAVDAALAVTGALLGGQVGLGTVLVVLLVPPVVATVLPRAQAVVSDRPGRTQGTRGGRGG